MKKVILIIFICFFTFGCEHKIYSRIPKDFSITLKNNLDIEVYTEIYLNDLIKDINAQIISDNDLLNTEKLGEKKHKIIYKFNNKKYYYDIEYNVVDTTIPRVFGGSSKTVLIEHEEDICNLFLIGDNYDNEPKCDIEGYYNLKTVGSYNLKLNIADSSNNKNNHSFILNVIKKNEISNTTPIEIPFSEALELYKNDNTELGLDVSEWQKDIDFEKIREAGVTFVIMRIGVQTGKEREVKIDNYYEQNIKRAKEAGLKVGVYLFSVATSVEEAEEQALWVVDKLAGISLDLPIVFDWEYFNYWNYYKISFYDINAIANKFISTINDKGYTGMLYSSRFYLENIWNINNTPVWLAHYTSQTSYEGNFNIWQFTSNGIISGIEGYVDINVLYK